MRNIRKFTVLLLFLLALCLPALCAQAASGQISGYAWQAQSGDTTYDANDRGLSGVVVTLHRAQDGAELSQQTVDRNGAFAFTGLSAGEYYLSAKLPAGYQFIEPAENGSVMLPADGGSSTSAAPQRKFTFPMPLRRAFSLASAMAAGTISAPMTRPARRAITCVMVPAPQ